MKNRRLSGSKKQNHKQHRKLVRSPRTKIRAEGGKVYRARFLALQLKGMKSSCEFSFEADGRCRATISAANREEFVGYLVRLMLSALSGSPPGSSNAAAAASRSPVAADVSALAFVLLP